MKDFWKGIGMAMALGLLALATLFIGPVAQAPLQPDGGESLAEETTPAPALDAASTGEKIEADCQILQTMCFSRCGHSVARRIHPPQSLIGADFETTQHYYDVWQIKDFSATALSMRREIDLYCPMHQVAGVTEAGEIVISENQYGDGMAIVAETGRRLEEFSEETQTQLLLGLGFDSRDEAIQWLATH